MTTNIDRVKRFIEFINREYIIDVTIAFCKWEDDNIIIDVGFNDVVKTIKVFHLEENNLDYNYLYERVIELVDNLIVKAYRNS